MLISVIVPTRNRCQSVERSIRGVLATEAHDIEYEIVVVDNGSTDSTRMAVENLMSHDRRVRYYYEENPGLHNARHRGAKEARGSVLAYIDDDVLVSEHWLQGLHEAFRDPSVCLATGSILPFYEADPPEWFDLHWSSFPFGRAMGWLSLVEYCPETQHVEPEYVFGSNFVVRKDVLVECRGFHPDSMPEDLLIYRGDGETGLAQAISGFGHKAAVNTRATVFHVIEKERLTEKYLYKRAFSQGVSYSYSQVRAGRTFMVLRFAIRIARIYFRLLRETRLLHRSKVLIWLHYARGFLFHQRNILFDRGLTQWIRQESYM